MTNQKLKSNILFIFLITLTIVFQTISSYINFAGFSITLALFPIVLASIIFGPIKGAICGFAFSIVVLLFVVFGIDVQGLVLFQSKPIATSIACILKGVLAGLISGILFKVIPNKKIAIVVSCIMAPIVNTFVFIVFLVLFFNQTFALLFTIIISTNFLFEFIVNASLTVVASRVLKHYVTIK